MASILCIDDDRRTIDLVGATLTLAGHAVFPAAGGLAGLKIFNSRRFDLVITEILMPGTDGLDVIANLKMNSYRPKIIATFKDTIWVNRGPWLVATRLAGADRVLFKPFGADRLLACLNGLLG